MVASASERSKARYIRRRIKAGKASDAQKEWLARYERNHRQGRPPKRKATKRKATPKPSSEEQKPEAAPPPPSTQLVRIAFPEPGEEHDDGGEEHDDGGEEHDDGGEEHDDGPKCDIPDCPACKNHRTGRRCQNTGTMVYPPMGDLAANMAAAGLFGALSFTLMMFRGEGAPANKKERENLAAGLKEMQHRRASWIGAMDDVLLVVGAIGGWGIRVAAESKAEKRRSQQNQGLPEQTEAAE